MCSLFGRHALGALCFLVNFRGNSHNGAYTQLRFDIVIFEVLLHFR